MKALDIDLARKVLSVVDAGLVRGIGEPIPGNMCVEAAVCYALGEPHGDSPSCVAEPDRAFKIVLNDACWSSNQARATGLRRLSVMQLSTDGTDREGWTRILFELTIRRILPEVAEIAAKLVSSEHAAALRAAGARCMAEGTVEAALALKTAANAANADYAAANAANAANAAASAANAAANADYAAYAANAAAYAAYAAANAAYAAANAANAAYAAANAAYAAYAAYAANAANADYAAASAAYAAYAAECDRILTISARCAEEAYERTGSFGVELLKQIEAK